MTQDRSFGPDPQVLDESDRLRATTPLDTGEGSTVSRVRIALLEHARNVLLERNSHLRGRVQELETALAEERTQRQQLIEQYERIIAEKEQLVTET